MGIWGLGDSTLMAPSWDSEGTRGRLVVKRPPVVFINFPKKGNQKTQIIRFLETRPNPVTMGTKRVLYWSRSRIS